MVNSNLYHYYIYIYTVYIYVYNYIYSNFTMCGCFFHEASTTGSRASFSTMPRKRQASPVHNRGDCKRGPCTQWSPGKTRHPQVTWINESYWWYCSMVFHGDWKMVIGPMEIHSDWDRTITKYGDVLGIKQMIPSGNLLQSSGKSPSVVGKS